jgi:long-chain fatty acid transport protein
MKKLASMFLVFVFTVFLSGGAYAANGMQAIGAGSVMRSMGGAGSALPLESSVITVNPAGMSELERRVDFSATYCISDSEYKSTDLMAGSTGSIDSDKDPGAMPSLGLLIPVNDKINFGLGAYGVAGMGVDYPRGLYGNVVFTSFEMMKLIPAFSYKINNTFSVGAGLNLDYGRLGFEAGGQEAHEKDGQFGYGIQFGVLGKFTDEISASLAYISKQDFADFEFSTSAGKDKLELDMPQQVIVGFGYKFNQSLRLATDIKWINWSDTMGKNLPSWSTNSSGATPWNCDWDDQFVYAIGIEFDATDDLHLRAGYNYGKTPISSDRAFENIAFPAIQEHHYTVGLGWDINKKMSINAGFMYAPENTISGSNAAMPPAGQAITNYETSLDMKSIELGISYKF